MLRADRAFVLVERREVAHVHAEDMLLDVVWQRLDLVRRMFGCRYGEHLVELFEREGFRLGDEEQDGEEPDNVPRGVPPEGTLRLERAEQTRESDCNNEVARVRRQQTDDGHGEEHSNSQEPEDRSRERHPNITHVQRERLGGVGKRHGTLSGRVCHRVEVDTKSDNRQTGLALRNEEREARHKQEDGHERECRQEQVPPAECIDGPHSREREDPIEHAEAPRRDQGLQVVESGLAEDGGRVVSDDVDAAELLHEHDDEGAEGGAAVTGDGEQLEETVAAFEGLGLSLELYVDV